MRDIKELLFGFVLGFLACIWIIQGYTRPIELKVIKEVDVVNRKHPNLLTIDTSFQVWVWDNTTKTSYKIPYKTLEDMASNPN